MSVELFKPKTRLFRGNLHGHSRHSDGVLDNAEVVETYQNLGYDFICISDHLWSDTRFCAQTVNPYAYSGSDTFLSITSAEIHCRGKAMDRDGLWHILANGLPLDFGVADDTETGADLVRRAVDAGAFVSIAHPEWYSMTTEEALALDAAHAVEIYNHSCAIEAGRGGGTYVVDLLLNNDRPVGIIATDDSHFRIPDAGGGWVMVAAEELTSKAIISSLKLGHYYSSTGPNIYDIVLENSILSISCSAVETICVAGMEHRSLYDNGSSKTKAYFDLTDFHSDWFRISITDAAGKTAWSNPYWKGKHY